MPQRERGRTASKEWANAVLASVSKTGPWCSLIRDAVLEFIQAAARRLPTENAIARDRQRKRGAYGLARHGSADDGDTGRSGNAGGSGGDVGSHLAGQPDDTADGTSD